MRRRPSAGFSDSLSVFITRVYSLYSHVVLRTHARESFGLPAANFRAPLGGWLGRLRRANRPYSATPIRGSWLMGKKGGR